MQELLGRHPVATAVVDRGGAIVAWNRAAEALFGYRADDALGEDFETLLVPADQREESREAVREAGELGAACFTGERLHQDGTRIPVKTFIAIGDGDESGYLFVNQYDQRGVYCQCGVSPDAVARKPDRALTMRQRQVLRLMAEGRSTREIAHRLTLSVKTIETHRGHLMERLKLKTVAGLVRYAVSVGLVPTSPWATGSGK